MSVIGSVSVRFATGTETIALPTSARFCSPVAVVTIGARLTATAVRSNETFTTESRVMVTVFFCPSKPMRCARTSAGPNGILASTTLPSAPVVPVVFVPTIETRTCGTGCA